MNVLHAGSEGGRRVCGAWWLFVSQQAEGALWGNPVPGSCAADVFGLKSPLCCNVILLFIRQAGVSFHRQVWFIRSIFQRRDAALTY